MKRALACLTGVLLCSLASAAPEYSIEAIRFASTPDVPLNALVVGAPQEQKVEIAFTMWLIRGGGRNVLFDSGFHREHWFKEWNIQDFVRPDEAVKLAGVKPEEVTDLVISHAHWDHIGGIDLFPKANLWIQRDEYHYYTETAWQPKGQHGGIDAEDMLELLRINTQGRLHLVDGDDVEILPGIRVYTGARHTYASQYVRVEGHPTYVLASDNAYFYVNLREHKASATFGEEDHAANIRNQDRMAKLAGSAERVIPGHDTQVFQKYPTSGRSAKIKP